MSLINMHCVHGHVLNSNYPVAHAVYLPSNTEYSKIAHVSTNLVFLDLSSCDYRFSLDNSDKLVAIIIKYGSRLPQNTCPHDNMNHIWKHSNLCCLLWKSLYGLC